MGLLDALFGSPAVLYDQETRQKINLGVILSESFSLAVDTSSYPIEVGSDFTGEVSDHVQPVPDSFSIDIVLTDPHPVSIAFFTDGRSVQEKLSLLEYWMKDGILLVYSGPKMGNIIQKVYQITENNLQLDSISGARSTDDGTAIQATLTLTKRTIVQAMFADIKLPQAAKPIAQKGTGTTASAEVPEPPAAKEEIYFASPY